MTGRSDDDHAMMRQLRANRVSLAGQPGLIAGVRWQRVAVLTVTGVLALFGLAVLWTTFVGQAQKGYIGWDVGLYTRIAQRWLDTGQLYYPVQLAGPYAPAGDVNLYPPIALYLFLPFLWLPRILWWAIPLALLSWTVLRFRPAPWSWPILVVLMGTVPFTAMLSTGNSNMWVIGFTCLALRWPAAAALLMFKPSILPLALPFLGHRSTWLVFALGLLAWAPLGAFLGTWWTASRNMTGVAFLYSWSSYPMLCIPFVIRLASTRYPVTLLRAR